jgi:hypothetical protein
MVMFSDRVWWELEGGQGLVEAIRMVLFLGAGTGVLAT